MTFPWRTALVTGASSGIGQAFARALARRGCDVVLVARRADRLETLAAELGAHGVKAELLPADLLDPAGLDAVESRLADRDRPVDLLVNNAGIGNTGPYAELALAGQLRTINLNVVALARLTRAALPAMIQRRRGAILNVSSMAAFIPEPFGATYVASKAFVNSFTESIAGELHGTGVRAMALCPGFTTTEFHERLNFEDAPTTGKRGGGQKVPARLWMTPEAVAEAGLKGLEEGRVVTIPGLAYRAVAGLLHVIPRSTVRRLTGRAMHSSRKG